MNPAQTLAVAASAIGLVMTGTYVALIVRQGGGYEPGTVALAASMVIASTAPLLAQRRCGGGTSDSPRGPSSLSAFLEFLVSGSRS